MTTTSEYVMCQALCWTHYLHSIDSDDNLAKQVLLVPLIGSEIKSAKFRHHPQEAQLVQRHCWDSKVDLFSSGHRPAQCLPGSLLYHVSVVESLGDICQNWVPAKMANLKLEKVDQGDSSQWEKEDISPGGYPASEVLTPIFVVHPAVASSSRMLGVIMTVTVIPLRSWWKITEALSFTDPLPLPLLR